MCAVASDSILIFQFLIKGAANLKACKPLLFGNCYLQVYENCKVCKMFYIVFQISSVSVWTCASSSNMLRRQKRKFLCISVTISSNCETRSVECSEEGRGGTGVNPAGINSSSVESCPELCLAEALLCWCWSYMIKARYLVLGTK